MAAEAARVDTHIAVNGQPARHLVIALGHAVIVFIAVHVRCKQTLQSQIRDARSKVIANELETADAEVDPRRQRMVAPVVARAARNSSTELSSLPARQMHGGLFPYVLEQMEDWQQWQKLPIHERRAVGGMFDECEAERLAQLFHLVRHSGTPRPVRWDSAPADACCAPCRMRPPGLVCKAPPDRSRINAEIDAPPPGQRHPPSRRRR